MVAFFPLPAPSSHSSNAAGRGGGQGRGAGGKGYKRGGKVFAWDPYIGGGRNRISNGGDGHALLPISSSSSSSYVFRDRESGFRCLYHRSIKKINAVVDLWRKAYVGVGSIAGEISSGDDVFPPSLLWVEIGRGWKQAMIRNNSGK